MPREPPMSSRPAEVALVAVGLPRRQLGQRGVSYGRSSCIGTSRSVICQVAADLRTAFVRRVAISPAR